MERWYVRTALSRWNCFGGSDHDSQQKKKNTQSRSEKTALVESFMRSLMVESAKRHPRHKAEVTRVIRFVQHNGLWILEEMSRWDTDRWKYACMEMRNELFSLSLICLRWENESLGPMRPAEITWAFQTHTSFVSYAGLRLIEASANRALRRELRHQLPHRRRDFRTMARHWINERLSSNEKWQLLVDASENTDVRVSVRLWNDIIDWKSTSSTLICPMNVETSQLWYESHVGYVNNKCGLRFLKDCLDYALDQGDLKKLNFLIDASIARLGVTWDETYRFVAEPLFNHAFHRVSVECARTVRERCCGWLTITSSHLQQSWNMASLSMLSWLCDEARINDAKTFIDAMNSAKNGPLGLCAQRYTRGDKKYDKDLVDRLQWFMRRYNEDALRPLLGDLRKLAAKENWKETTAWLCERFINNF
jgi:hypothetical protein